MKNENINSNNKSNDEQQLKKQKKRLNQYLTKPKDLRF